MHRHDECEQTEAKQLQTFSAAAEAFGGGVLIFRQTVWSALARATSWRARAMAREVKFDFMVPAQPAAGNAKAIASGRDLA